MVTFQCEVCGNWKSVRGSPAGKKYCSRACYGQAHIQIRRRFKCGVCGIDMTATRSHDGVKYCSRSCAASAKTTRTVVVCQICGKSRTVKVGLVGRAKYCSRACSAKAQRETATARMIAFECEVCGKRGVARRNRGVSTKYCSIKCFGKAQRHAPGEVARNAVLGHYRSSARARNLDWGLSPTEAMDVFTSECHYCGIGPSNVQVGRSVNDGSFLYNGIDRVNNLLGYIPSNVVPCCKICNYAKFTMSISEFEAWILRAAKHLRKLRRGIGGGRSVAQLNLYQPAPVRSLNRPIVESVN